MSYEFQIGDECVLISDCRTIRHDFVAGEIMKVVNTWLTGRNDTHLLLENMQGNKIIIDIKEVDKI